ncbi:MAG: ClpXP protease specificity-enhancing factor [Burkholderiales bacterium]|jgi:stringent starvation protein B|nr:ClpXP protease specificity-enhancing factor [Burkholderiales bacterium]
MLNAPDASSTRPYLLRALHEWCTDNGYTPYIAVQVDEMVQVPQEYVKNGEIVLNVSYDATSNMSLGNDVIEFKARFAGTPREIIVPVDRVLAIYARENGQGMAFPMRSSNGTETGATTTALAPSEARASLTAVSTSKPSTQTPEDDAPPPTTPNGRPSLKRVK